MSFFYSNKDYFANENLIQEKNHVCFDKFRDIYFKVELLNVKQKCMKYKIAKQKMAFLLSYVLIIYHV